MAPTRIIDTYAWIEYFSGTETGLRIKSIIEGGGNITPTIVLAELRRKYTEWGRRDFEERLGFIADRTEILPLDTRTAVLSGKIRASPPSRNMGIVDCILLAVARLTESKVLTGDEHFRDLEEAEYFGK